MVEHKNKWKNIGLMDEHYVVGVTTTPCPKFEVIIEIISKEDITYHVTIGDIPHSSCHKNVLTCFRKEKEISVSQTFLLCV